MTLYRQLLLSTLIILISLCTGLWMGELKRTRDFLINQMATHAQDTATSLGLSMTTLAEGSDLATMETMINAVFDRGYYRAIELRNMEGKLLVDRHVDLNLGQTPSWFAHLVPLSAPQATSLVMHGWRQTGEVLVESHPGYAYQTLWQAARSITLWFAMTGLTVVLLGGLGLRILLKPLGRVEEQAMALCDRQFNLQEQLPRTRELRRVVTAMNRMTTRIREMFDEQAAIAETLRQHTYQDPLTATGNRRYLEAQVKVKLAGKEITPKGAFLLFQIQKLQGINQEKGYQEGDRIIRQTAEIIQETCYELPEVILARMNGGDFALLLPNADEQTSRRIGDAILGDIHRQDRAESGATVAVCGGGVLYEQSASFNQLLTRADMALSSARYTNNHQVTLLPLIDGKETMALGKTQWKEMLAAIIANRSITLYSQPTVTHPDLTRTVHHEILTRVIDSSGRHQSVGMFIPMAERLGMMPTLDRIIIERILEQPMQQIVPKKIAINLSPLSLTDTGFVAWLQKQLEQCAKEGFQFNFEFPEFRIIRHSKQIKEFAAILKAQGHGIGIDHFGQGLMAFGYLKSLLPDYVKIDRAITCDLVDAQSDRYFFVNTLCNVAHSLAIKVIVEGVENESQWRTLAKLHLDAVQGFYIKSPEPWSKGCQR